MKNQIALWFTAISALLSSIAQWLGSVEVL